MTQSIFDAWVTRTDSRVRRSWQNAEIPLGILEACGDPPPADDAEPPDHEITLSELIVKSRELDSPEAAARRAKESRGFDFEAYRRTREAKKASHRSAWMEFKRRNDLDTPPAA